MADPSISPTLQASSAVRKSGISTTLPRNFAPLSLDHLNNEPRTPVRTFAEIDLPPPPPHSIYRMRRPRTMMDKIQARNNALPATLFASDIPPPSSPFSQRLEFALTSSMYRSDEPIPSIETSFETPTTRHRPLFQRGSSEPAMGDSLHIPGHSEQLPRTPPAQLHAVTPEIKRGKWDMQRAASVCSARSDSSISSGESYATRPTSFDGSATSPDCDNHDPFLPQIGHVIPDTPARRSKKMRINTSFSRDTADWSIEMDNHLFNVYQMYLADPTVTPFKTVPGSVPPTGVCHRVARRAKETWPKASRIGVPIIKRYKLRNLLDIRRNVRDKTPELDDFLKTNDTPKSSEGYNNWPSESSTRRRLKQLCREKFTITAHYQRLRESRSPSPFSEQFTRRPTPRLSRAASRQLEDPEQTGAYTTRELGISLVANDATAPLARVVSDDTPVLERPTEEWFNRPVETVNVVDVPPASSASVQADRLAPAAAKIPRLASPFSYSTWNGPGSRHPHRRHISHGHYDTMHATGSRLLSPFQLDSHVGINANKRRAQHNLEDELSPSGSHLGSGNGFKLASAVDMPLVEPKPELRPEIVFTGSGDFNQRRIRLRNRGATLGSAAFMSGPERIERLFTPPLQMQGSDMSAMPQLPAFLADEPAAEKTKLLTIPGFDAGQRRLGSPFELDPNKRSVRSRSPRHVPSLSDPFISTDHFGIHGMAGVAQSGSSANNIDNIGERLALFSGLDRQDQIPK